MASFLAIVTAGALCLGATGAPKVAGERAGALALALLLGATALVLVGAVGSLRSVGLSATLEYALQRVERDGVSSRGGTWNQLQLSSLPLALGALGLGIGIAPISSTAGQDTVATPVGVGLAFVVLGLGLNLLLSVLVWPGLRAFKNPRWLAHSLREIATFPFTAVPLAIAVGLIVERTVSGSSHLLLTVGPLSIALLGLALCSVLMQWSLLRGVDVLAIAQKPSFASQSLDVHYLLASHVFEHALDIALLALLTGGLYAAGRLVGSG
jgi:hypothetical protein